MKLNINEYTVTPASLILMQMHKCGERVEGSPGGRRGGGMPRVFGGRRVELARNEIHGNPREISPWQQTYYNQKMQNFMKNEFFFFCVQLSRHRIMKIHCFQIKNFSGFFRNPS